MATITKTFTENQSGSLYASKATWTITITGTNQTVSSDFDFVYPTMTAKYVDSTKKLAFAMTQARCVIVGGSLSQSQCPFGNYRLIASGSTVNPISWASNVTKTVPLTSTVYKSITLSNLFNTSNKSTRSLSVQFYNDQEISLRSYVNSNYYNEYYSTTVTNWGTISTITLDVPPTIQYGTPTYSNPQYAGLGAYTVPITSAEAYYGGDVSKITLTIGQDSTEQTYSATTISNQTISVIPTIAGTYTPTITVEDSRGQTKTETLPQITVNPYNVPSVSFDVYRTNNIGIKNDEGHYALIQSTISYTDGAITLTEPSIQIDGVDLSSLTDASVTWYKTWSNTSGVSNVISDWTTLVPQNHMVTIYGLIDWDYDTTGNFAEDTSYQIILVANDSVNGHSTPITQTMSTAFYTIDFQAGGKEIAFGAPANDNLSQHPNGLFKCAMDAQFEGGVSGEAFLNMFYPVGSYYETSDNNFDPNVTWGGTWVKETQGQVHVSSGVNYTVGGALTNTSDGGEEEHTLTVDEIPSHTHPNPSNGAFLVNNGSGTALAFAAGSYHRAAASETGARGGGQAHNNMQPYIVVNRWHRTA